MIPSTKVHNWLENPIWEAVTR